MALRVVLVDDHPIMREGLRLVLQQIPGLEIIGEADNGRDAISMVTQSSPDVVVMDVSMPKLTGVEATRIIKASNPDVKIIGVSAYAYVGEMLRAGASAYVHKAAASNELVLAIGAVMKGARFVSPALQVMGGHRNGTGPKTSPS